MRSCSAIRAVRIMGWRVFKSAVPTHLVKSNQSQKRLLGERTLSVLAFLLAADSVSALKPMSASRSLVKAVSVSTERRSQLLPRSGPARTPGNMPGSELRNRSLSNEAAFSSSRR